MTLLVRDEEDILEANLDYHLRQGVDFVVATDHQSRDGTPDILRRYEQMGVLCMLKASGEEHHQARHVTHMARLAAARYGADWVINNDADEFWWPALATLKDLFSVVPDRYGQMEVPRHNFLPRPDDQEPFYRRLIVRETASLNPSGMALEPKVTHRAAPGVTVAPGNHTVRDADLVRAPDFGGVEILHFPMRSYPQFERKVINTGIGYERLESRSPDVGRDQLKLLDRYRRGVLRDYFDERLLSDAQLAEGLERGSLVVDRRLERFLAQQPPSTASSEDHRPEALALARLSAQVFAYADSAEAIKEELARTALQQQARLDGSSLRLDHAVARLEAAETSLAEAERNLAGVSAQLAEVTSELESTRHSYDLVLHSKTIRLTRRPRALYYALRGRG